MNLISDCDKKNDAHKAGLEMVTDTVANATNIFSLATKNSGLVTTLVTRFLCDLDLNLKSNDKTNISSYLALLSS